MTDEEKPDVELDLLDLEPYLAAYKSAKSKEKLAKVEAEKWKSAAEHLSIVITEFMDAEGANVGKIHDRHVCRYTHFDKPQFQSVKFRDAHPELAGEFEKFTDKNPQTKFTVYDDET